MSVEVFRSALWDAGSTPAASTLRGSFAKPPPRGYAAIHPEFFWGSFAKPPLAATPRFTPTRLALRARSRLGGAAIGTTRAPASGSRAGRMHGIRTVLQRGDAAIHPDEARASRSLSAWRCRDRDNSGSCQRFSGRTDARDPHCPAARLSPRRGSRFALGLGGAAIGRAPASGSRAGRMHGIRTALQRGYAAIHPDEARASRSLSAWRCRDRDNSGPCQRFSGRIDAGTRIALHRGRAESHRDDGPAASSKHFGWAARVPSFPPPGWGLRRTRLGLATCFVVS